jgi:hypothetical protein
MLDGMEERWVRIADLREAGAYAGRTGRVGGWSILGSAPDSARDGPVIGAHVGGSDKSDVVYGVNFDDGMAWFAPHLLEDPPEQE